MLIKTLFTTLPALSHLSCKFRPSRRLQEWPIFNRRPAAALPNHHCAQNKLNRYSKTLFVSFYYKSKKQNECLKFVYISWTLIGMNEPAFNVKVGQ